MLEFADRLEQFFRIETASEALVNYIGQDGRRWVDYLREYTEAVRNAARTNNEIYSGPHAFRVNYAEGRYDKLAVQGDESDESEKKTLTTITEELGHSRISMAKYYLPQYRK